MAPPGITNHNWYSSKNSTDWYRFNFSGLHAHLSVSVGTVNSRLQRVLEPQFSGLHREHQQT